MTLDLKKSFQKEISNNHKEIDPDEELDWYSLSMGYFLAKGASPEEAEDLSIEIRYRDKYFL